MTDIVVTSLINGSPVANAGGHLMPVINPATEELVCQLREADVQEVGDAVAAARSAFPSWAAMGTDRRNDILYAICDTLTAHADELAEMEVRTTGLPISGVRPLARRAAHNFRAFAEVASTLSGESYSQAENYMTYVTREPKGVGALIAPWNAPLALGSMRIATCIAFGNTCVLKPSEYTPLSMFRMVELMHEAGLPDGVVNLVNGRGHVSGEAMVSHPDIDMIGFTGGSETGRRIMATAGRNLKPAILELGGKSAAIVCADADLDQALDGALLGIYSNNGQQCLAGSRILVQRSIADRFIADFVARAKAIRIGDPMAASTQIGPLAFAAHRDRVLSFVDVATQDGAELLTGGGRPDGFDQGFYIDPIAVLAPSNAARICQEEVFGPFATFVIFDEVEDAIRIANDSAFGLVAYVWTGCVTTAMRCSKGIRAGTIWINTPMMRELRAPFGGFRESGIGRDGARSSADFFTEMKTTSIPIEPLTLNRLGI
ncbi:5-carboxymethyl-2-hydroxymuconic-semialdehyde dehydrogenase [Sphingobium sp. AP50]|uniref:aldehyde dehydrogenase n=1 Tax=Sphingobium sp. AP50 TaxID=1884369 RepID=UPI0008D509E5|nr:aldehyde dehydrogenase [Sphingobium sp. AP50]SEJ96683.1 5-carboxymethyl-2-hydroxymuconic-semialdehyde dehydrogenase [Sphingobium sp. AP50]